jgi:hypothetical protein
MKGCVNLFGEFPAYSGDFGQLLRCCCKNPCQPAESRDKRFASRRANAWKIFKSRGLSCFATPGTVTGYGEAVRFIANLLDQVQCRVFRG